MAELSLEQVEAARRVILGSTGLDVLRLLRAVFYRERIDGILPEAVQWAIRLNWLEMGSGGPPRLTSVGARIADSAREYCNWLDDGQALPPGVGAADWTGLRVLDLGCGCGRHLLALSGTGARAVGIDLEESYLQISRILGELEGVGHPRLIQARGERLPFPDESFDVVLCTRSLSYMDVGSAVREVSRVLADGGRLVVVIGNFGSVVLRLFNPRTWFRGPRVGASVLLEAVNSIYYQWFGRRVRPLRPDRSTGSPVRLTDGGFRRLLGRAGLGVEYQDTGQSLVVAVRSPRRKAGGRHGSVNGRSLDQNQRTRSVGGDVAVSSPSPEATY